MKMSRVRIDRRGFGKKSYWEIGFEDFEGDFERQKTAPSGLGFFSYPTKKGRLWAFEQLRAHMRKLHEDQIELLQKSLDALVALEYIEKK